MTDDQAFDAQRFVDVVELAERECSVEKCSAPPAATYSTVTPIDAGRASYDVVWACHDHLDRLQALVYKSIAEGTGETGWTQELLRYCCLGSGCDSAATHIVFVIRDYGPAQRLEALSVCSRHASEAERQLLLQA